MTAAAPPAPSWTGRLTDAGRRKLLAQAVARGDVRGVVRYLTSMSTRRVAAAAAVTVLAEADPALMGGDAMFQLHDAGLLFTPEMLVAVSRRALPEGSCAYALPLSTLRERVGREDCIQYAIGVASEDLHAAKSVLAHHRSDMHPREFVKVAGAVLRRAARSPSPGTLDRCADVLSLVSAALHRGARADDGLSAELMASLMQHAASALPPGYVRDAEAARRYNPLRSWTLEVGERARLAHLARAAMQEKKGGRCLGRDAMDLLRCVAGEPVAPAPPERALTPQDVYRLAADGSPRLQECDAEAKQAALHVALAAGDARAASVLARCAGVSLPESRPRRKRARET